MTDAFGIVAFRFDDNHAPDDWRAVAEVFESEGMRCSFAVVNGALNSEQGQCLKELSDRGFEIMDHTASHAMFACQWLEDADFAAETNHPFVAEAQPQSRKVYCRPDVDLTNAQNVAFVGRVRGGVLETDDANALKQLTWTKKVWIPSRQALYGITFDDGKRVLRDFWCRTVPPFDVPDETMTLVHQIAIQPCADLLRLQARASRKNLAKFGISKPQTWIQPGGWEAFVDARRMAPVYGNEFGYTGADCVMPHERCWYSTDDPTPKTLVRWMQRPSFSYFDEGATFDRVIAQIEKSEKVGLPLVFISHMKWNVTGDRQIPENRSRTAWLEGTRKVLRWIKAHRISTMTERKLTVDHYKVRYGWPKPDAWWWKRLAAKRERIGTFKGKTVDVVLLGDSITHGWDGKGALKRLQKTHTVLPLGYNGDTVASLLWRVWDGELDGYTAKNVFLLIGTNNLGGGKQQPERVIKETKRLVESIREKQPTAKVWLLAVLPRDIKHRETPELWPKRITAYNALLKELADGEHVFYHDMGPKFLKADGTLNDALYWDRLHPRDAGYDVWADEILQLLNGDAAGADCGCRNRSRSQSTGEAPYNDAGGIASNGTRRATQLGRLTPPLPREPRIHAPAVLAARPGHEIIYRLPVTGEKVEVEVEVEKRGGGGDEGVGVGVEGRVLRGRIAKAGDYPIRIRAKNAFGSDEKVMTIRVGEALCLTPPMGWNSWNCFFGMVTDRNLRDAADRLVSTGLADLGYQYVNMDAWWQINNNKQAKDRPEMHGKARDEQGRILSNSKFSDMKALTDYLHAKGLKGGIYSSPGPFSCGGCECSWRHEYQDAARFAEWGFDYLKYDWCSYANVVRDEPDSPEKFALPYRLMAQALRLQSRDIVLAMCEYGMGDAWFWAKTTGAQLWRTTGDVHDTWDRIEEVMRVHRSAWRHAAPGAWNDPDMLVVKADHAKCRLTPNEQYTHIGFWCLQAAPLLIGCDLTKIDDFTFGLLSNPELIAIDQDALGAAAACVASNGVYEVWARPLANGDIAFGVFNPKVWDVKVSVDLAHDLGMEGAWQIRCVWAEKDLGVFSGRFDVDLPAHMMYVYRTRPAAGGRLAPTLTDVRNLSWQREIEGKRPLVPNDPAANSGPPGTVLPKDFKFSP